MGFAEALIQMPISNPAHSNCLESQNITRKQTSSPLELQGPLKQ